MFLYSMYVCINLFGFRITAPITAVYAAVLSLCRPIIRIGVTNAVRTNALHDAPVITPMLRPINHVMVTWVVNTAMLSLAFIFVVNIENTIRSY